MADVRKLEALSRLAAMAEPAAPKPSHRGIAIVFAILSLSVVSLMLFKRATKTAVELEALVTAVRFRITEPVQSRSLLVKSISVSGANISDPDEVLGRAPVGARIEADGGAITVQHIKLSNATVVTLERDSQSALQFDINGEGAVIEVSLSGKLRVSGRPAEFKIPRSLSFTTGASPADIRFVFPGDADADLFRQWPIDSLSTFEADESRTRRVSSIKSGAIFFEELNSQERKLREAEHIQFGAVDGRIRTARFTKGEIALRFDGTIQGLTTGAGDPRPLMPTWLDLARANQPLVLLWTTAAYIIGVLFAILKWLDFNV